MMGIDLLEKAGWFGAAALGFAILFNTPRRTLIYIFIFGAFGGIVKTVLMSSGVNVVVASLGGAILIGYISVFAAHDKHAPPMVFAIPAVIPMVPGVTAYRTMLGLINLSVPPNEHYQTLLTETIHYGLNTLFILLSLALGVAIPLMVSRKETIKKEV